MSLLPYHKGNKTNFINLLFTLTRKYRLIFTPFETVRKVKHSSQIIENLLLALYRGTESLPQKKPGSKTYNLSVKTGLFQDIVLTLIMKIQNIALYLH